MKTYALGAALFGTLTWFTTTANASDTQVRFNVHLGIPVHGPVVVHPYPHVVHAPVVYHDHYGQGHLYYKHPYPHGYAKPHHPGSHWRHYDRGHGQGHAAYRDHQRGGHGWRGR